MIDNHHIDTFTNRNGIDIRIRKLLPKDAPYLVDLFENMGADSRYHRFMEPLEHITVERVWTEAEKIAQGANGETYGLVAFVDTPERDNVPVGGARYVKLSRAQAEFAVSVRDDMQGTGIGTYLTRLLVAQASEDGLERLVGILLNDNVSMWRLLKNLGYRLESHPEGSYSLVALHIRESASHTQGWQDTADDFSPEPQIIW